MQQDVELFAGDYKLLNVTVTDAAGDAVDLTDFTIRWQLAAAANKTPILSKEIGSGITVVNASEGRFDVQLDSDDTEALAGSAVKTYYHEAEVIDAADRPATVMWGAVTINPTLIKPAA